MLSALTGMDLWQNVKQTAGLPGPTLCLAVGSPLKAVLRPVSTKREGLRPQDVRLLTEWRNRFSRSFLTEFTATEAQTAEWLINVIGTSENRLFFMVDDPMGRTFAHLGLTNVDWDRSYVEVDNVVRGGESLRGTMTMILREFIVWIKAHLGLQTIEIRVRSDNTAVEFYRKLGFQEISRVPLRQENQPHKTLWVEDPLLTVPLICVIRMMAT